MDVGKSAKHMGIAHPRVVRKMDPVPIRATPAAKAGVKVRKKYGYTYERRWKPDGKWNRVTHYSWYATERKRNDAMRAAGGYYRGFMTEIRDVQPTTR